MKPILAVFSLLLLTACQSITSSNANGLDVSTSDTLVEKEGAEVVLPVVQENNEFIVPKLLKKAVDVKQIDSLMVIDESNPSDVQAQQVVTKREGISLPKAPIEAEDVPASKDSITLMLLERGAVALASQKLLTPEEDNANMYYQAALGREPDNVAAQQGLNEIVRFYTAWSLDKEKQGHKQTAKKYLDAAIFVDQKNPLIAKAKQDIKDWREGIRRPANVQGDNSNIAKVPQNKFYLPQNLFSYSEALVIEKLQPIIDRIEKDQLNIMIFWPNDKEARLLYQIINSRTEDFRVRGMIYRRAQHMIEVKQG